MSDVRWRQGGGKVEARWEVRFGGGGVGSHSRLCWSSISSSPSQLGLSTLLLVETLDTVDISAGLCLNLLAIRPRPPPYVHLMSCDECSQAFPVFAALPLLYIIVNANQIAKIW